MAWSGLKRTDFLGFAVAELLIGLVDADLGGVKGVSRASTRALSATGLLGCARGLYKEIMSIMHFLHMGFHNNIPDGEGAFASCSSCAFVQIA